MFYELQFFFYFWSSALCVLCGVASKTHSPRLLRLCSVRRSVVNSSYYSFNLFFTAKNAKKIYYLSLQDSTIATERREKKMLFVLELSCAKLIKIESLVIF